MENSEEDAAGASQFIAKKSPNILVRQYSSYKDTSSIKNLKMNVIFSERFDRKTSLSDLLKNSLPKNKMKTKSDEIADQIIGNLHKRMDSFSSKYMDISNKIDTMMRKIGTPEKIRFHTKINEKSRNSRYDSNYNY